jgi:hypothetical protein
VVLAVTTTTGNAMSGKSASFSDRKLNRPSSDRPVHSASVIAGESIASLEMLGRGVASVLGCGSSRSA